MSFDLAQALGAALDGGCSLAELETTLLAGADSDDQIAAAWLYAWAYDAICPTRVELAARITSGAVAGHPLKRRVTLDAAIDPSVIRGTLSARSGDRRDSHARLGRLRLVRS
jgi:hypothetical protein